MEDRIDRALVARGLAASRERAQMLVRSGLVRIDGAVAERPSQMVTEAAQIEVTGEALPYVGRGGLKLEAALRHFRLNVSGALCLDVGAATGGFTDCLLQRGAARVMAIDVGHGQMAPSLREDPRVELREGVNARYLSPEQFDTRYDLAAVDVSFISLTLVLPAVAPLVRPGGHIVALIKPEFEAGREAVGPRGVVRSASARQAAVEKIKRFARTELGLQVRGVVPTPVMGGGNREFAICLRRLPDTPADQDAAEQAEGPTPEDA